MLESASPLPLEPATQSASPSLAAGKSGLQYLVLVLIFTALPFLGSLRFGFVYDDEVQIVTNESIRSWHYLPSYFTTHTWNFLYSDVGNYYRPIFLLWLRCNYALFHLNPDGWHLTSVLLHVAVTALLFLALQGHGFPPWISAAAALCFGLSPTRIESVSWISGTTDTLALFFLLTSLLLWKKHSESGKYLHLCLAALSFFLALLSKETAIVFIVILLYYAGQTAMSGPNAANSSWWTRSVTRLAPFLLSIVLYFSLRFLALRSISNQTDHIPLKTILFTIPSLLWFYLRHAVWPYPLSLFYNTPLVLTPEWAQFWVPTLFLLVVVSLVLWLGVVQKIRGVLLACAWFLLPLAPVSMLPFLPKNEFVHDRYLYISGVGVAIFISALLHKYFDVERPPARIVGIVGAILLILGISTAIQAEPWRDNLSLYLNATRIAPNHPTALNNLATTLVERQQFVSAREILTPLVKSYPDYWLATYNLGYVSYKLGDFSTAETYLRRAALLDPKDSDQYLYLGLTFYKQARFYEAESLVRKAIAHRNTPRGYHFALGMILLAEQKVGEACQSFREELQLHPDQQAAQSQLAACENNSR